jgi:probable rRNA maturation factor
MIFIKNRQRKIPVNTQHLADQVKDMLAIAGYPDFGIGILLTTNRSIRTFNKQFRGKDKPTDVLSFPYYPKLKPGQRINARTEEEKYLGDMVISLEYALNDAPKTWARPFRDHLVVLVAHGIAHLLGHDHLTDEQWRLMQAAEIKLLSAAKA